MCKNIASSKTVFGLDPLKIIVKLHIIVTTANPIIKIVQSFLLIKQLFDSVCSM